MGTLLSQVVNGLAIGSIYAIFGLGFGLMLSTMGVLNAAHGTFATGGAIATLYLVNEVGLGFWVALPIAVGVSGLLSLAVYFAAFEPIRRRSSDLLPALITSIGVWTALLAVMRILTGARTDRYAPAGTPSGIVTFGDVRITYPQLTALAALAVVAVLFVWLFDHTRTGALMRAVGHDQDAAMLSGVNPTRVVAVTALLAGATAGLAGALLGMATDVVSFTLGEGLLLKGFAAVIIGGFSSTRGTILGGLLIGVSEILAAAYISGGARDALTFGVLLLFLVVRPQGIFGSSTQFGRA